VGRGAPDRTLGREHRDPFERILAARSAGDRLILANSDPAFSQVEGVELLS